MPGVLIRARHGWNVSIEGDALFGPVLPISPWEAEVGQSFIDKAACESAPSPEFLHPSHLESKFVALSRLISMDQGLVRIIADAG